MNPLTTQFAKLSAPGLMLLLLYRRSAAHCAQRRRGGPIPRAGSPIHGAVPQLGGEFLCCALQLHHSARQFDWQFRALSLGCGSSIRRSRIRPQTCSSLRSAEMGGPRQHLLPLHTGVLHGVQPPEGHVGQAAEPAPANRAHAVCSRSR